MFKYLIHKIVGTKNERELKRLQPRVAAINALEETIQRLADAEFRVKTDEFRRRLAPALEAENGDLAAALEELLPEAFAVCREAGRR
ncbi:MAG: hypothetical protein WC713_07555, partial [Candidatus Methylomirabilota bacterium]